MSGSSGGNRYKSKKQRNPVSSDDLESLIIRRIIENDKVGQDDIFQLYHISKPTCQGCRLNSKDSPNCFCGFVPPPGGSRKHGLWQKSSETQSELGPDPTETLRPSLDSPSGLTNLGATCYVNSVLQCLYRIKAFIKGFFAAEADLVQRQYVLHELALLFGQLHSGKKKAVDSAPLADVLELDNSIQQDGQEFLKLLLTSLEGLLGPSKNPQARSVVQDVFRGTLSHVTRCSKCGQESDASKQLVDFYELELNVKGLTSLEESLDDYLSEEQLQGENQFLCESCNTRVDATHCSKLRSLPPVLNFQLKRFVFDAKTATKKKVTSRFSFPRSLDMSSRLSVDGMDEKQISEPLVYDLSAILIHKGSTTNSGHYVADIRDDCTGQWWEFDDEQVTSLGFHPFGEASTTTKKDMNHKETHLKPGKPPGCAELSGDAHDLQSSEVKVTVHSEVSDRSDNCLTSADAYMLIYNLRERPEVVNQCSLSSIAMGPSNKSEQININYSEKQGDSLLPEYLRFEIEEKNTEFLEKCTKYKLKMEKELSNIADRRDEVRSILAEAPVQRQGDTFFWISSNWLRTWADDLTPPPPIDNSQLLCEHGKVPPKKLSLMKRISEGAWTKLQAKYGGGPKLSEMDCCIECIMENARAVASASSYRDQRKKVKQMLEDALASTELKGEYYFVSKTWLQNWLRRKSADAPSDADSFPTAAITCPHEALLPDNAPGAKRQAVPEEIWSYFLQIALQFKDDSLNGCLNFPVDTPTCTTCQADMMQVASQQQDLRAIKMEQRQRHELLFSGDSVSIVPGQTYYLVPSAWLVQWRSYLGGSSKKSLKADEPLGLEGCIRSLLCQKHEGLLFTPPTLQRNRRGELVQKTTNDDVFTVVSEDDWRDFCGQWDANPRQGIKALLEPLVKEDHFTCSIIESALPEIPVNGGCEVRQDDAFVALLRTKPEVCKECSEERESSELMRKLQYVGEEIYVDLVCGKEPPKSVLESSKGERRVSKRPRRGTASTNMRAVLRVSGDTTVYQLKLLIWESFAVVKENQRVHFGMKELSDDSATLADLNILPGAHLWVMDTGLHENRDIAEEISGQELDYVNMEEGFSGTLLARLPILAESFSLDASQVFQSQLDGDDNVLHQVCEGSCSLHITDDVEMNDQSDVNLLKAKDSVILENVLPMSGTKVEELGGLYVNHGNGQHPMPFNGETRISVETVREQDQSDETILNVEQQLEMCDMNMVAVNKVSSTESGKPMLLNGKEKEQ